MMRRPRTLSATFVRQVSTPGFYGDGRGGHGLSLLVKRMASTGRLSKSWCQRIRLGGKPRNVGIGPFPLVSLAEAREIAIDNARLARSGKHPKEHAVPTFAAAAANAIASRGFQSKSTARFVGSSWPHTWICEYARSETPSTMSATTTITVSRTLLRCSTSWLR